MKLKDTYITHDSDGEQILLDTSSSFAGLIRSNKTAAFIVECLKEETTQEKIVEAMFEKYDAPKDVLAKDVSEVIEKLRKVGALDE
ncbi:MAG: PqqD family protein [Firmicutes bacterium]|mgnify:FL=1|nr:PqqD family protein [Bacillota bacterium]